ncbi:hypothetical protein [Desulfonema ishimotonii]|uniref:hypothetical protein n=1 Tax=Desulfonema ishimotonii TaxID=45657 RepID=UPI000F56B93B|nr:hypothetical protein [Desulfonema ishimotonii]
MRNGQNNSDGFIKKSVLLLLCHISMTDFTDNTDTAEPADHVPVFRAEKIAGIRCYFFKHLITLQAQSDKSELFSFRYFKALQIPAFAGITVFLTFYEFMNNALKKNAIHICKKES